MLFSKAAARGVDENKTELNSFFLSGLIHIVLDEFCDYLDILDRLVLSFILNDFEVF